MNLKLSKVTKAGWIFIFLIGLATIYLYQSTPSDGPIFPCVFNKLLGLYCPGCGMSRAFNAFLHFDFYQSFRYNALPYVLFPIAILAFIRFLRKQSYDFWICIMVVIALLYGILRNLPLFDFMMPTTL